MKVVPSTMVDPAAGAAGAAAAHITCPRRRAMAGRAAWRERTTGALRRAAASWVGRAIDCMLPPQWRGRGGARRAEGRFGLRAGGCQLAHPPTRPENCPAPARTRVGNSLRASWNSPFTRARRMGKEAAPTAAYSAFPVRFQPRDDRVRYLYIRKHKCEAGGDEDLADRTLFLAAVPAR